MFSERALGQPIVVFRLQRPARRCQVPAKLKVSSVSMTTAADPLADPELLETEWDLAPLVDGEDRAGAERQLEEAQ